MKATVVRALTAAGALALGLAIGYSVQPAGAAPPAATDCVAHQSQPAPTPLARGHRVAV